jgi:hypothetical protein
MSWDRESLLTNSTRLPAGTVNSFGLTPLAVSVKMYGFVDGGDGVGGELPPHEAMARTARGTAIRTGPLCGGPRESNKLY